ncbi:MAG TPA: TPM domain-containing protein [Methylomirabilota bacterium]|nr:TPM domain-containing protein [Methylomirabilota bacterium]
MARHPRWVRRFMSEADLAAVARVVAEAERHTSAEIRVHLDHRCAGEPMRRAVEVFERLGMHRVAQRHGVLVYVAVADHKLALIGDAGIHARVGEAYWRGLVASVTRHFKEERPRDGFIHAVGELGQVLSRHFPRPPDDTNQLPDEVSIG